MPDDPLATDLPPAPPAPSPVIERNVTCGACGCKLARDGGIISTGETYKKFLKHDREMEKKDEEIARLAAELNAVKQERDALKGSGAPQGGNRRVGALVTRG